MKTWFVDAFLWRCAGSGSIKCNVVRIPFKAFRSRRGGGNKFNTNQIGNETSGDCQQCRCLAHCYMKNDRDGQIFSWGWSFCLKRVEKLLFWKQKLRNPLARTIMKKRIRTRKRRMLIHGLQQKHSLDSRTNLPSSVALSFRGEYLCSVSTTDLLIRVFRKAGPYDCSTSNFSKRTGLFRHWEKLSRQEDHSWRHAQE